MELIKQPNAWTCYPSVCCMITGEKISDFIKFVGHDGSAYWEESKHPDKVISFWDCEAFQYLASKRYFPFMGMTPDIIPSINDDREISITYNPKERSDVFFIIVVKSQRFKDCTHVILYHKETVYDPNPLLTETTNIKDYEVVDIIPVVKI